MKSRIIGAVRTAVFVLIGVALGIGIFIAFIGLQNAGLAVDASTLVTIVSFPENFTTTGICALLAMVGFFVTAILYIKNVKGSILFGIIITWGLGMLCQLVGLTKLIEGGRIAEASVYCENVRDESKLFRFNCFGDTSCAEVG